MTSSSQVRTTAELAGSSPLAGIGATAGAPRDDFTPHGYLDVPGHSAVSPRGVVRALGTTFTWHHPAPAGGYGGQRERYRVMLRLLTDAPVAAPYSTSRIKTLHTGGLRSTWFLAGADTLCLLVAADEPGAAWLEVSYTRVIAADGQWGESGLVGARSGAGVLLQAFEGGEAFLLHSDPAPAEVVLKGAEQQDVPVMRSGPAGAEVTVTAKIRVPVHPARTTTVTLTRGVSARQAREGHLIAAPREQLHAHLDADAQFWARAPRLTGDWPAHWRRGLHYDLETLRMVVRDPAGIFTHPWDGMQVQAPRVVLAEAALDALTLSRADPQRAAQLFLGTFADAPAAQVPCVREDGSDTMVSADGTSCGTGPQWGLPFLVAELLDARLGDDHWPAALYPQLRDYLDFWLTHRRDADGWLVHACSWESGQDLSPRFGDQPLGGGHPTWHLRPVDLHAAAAHGARVLARFAARVRPDDEARWASVAEELTDRTRQLWADGRFADHDGTGPTRVDDVMLLLPVALDVATDEQRAALAEQITSCTAEDLTWPAPTWVVLLALQRLGQHRRAADEVAQVLDRVYRRTDARGLVEGACPGIAHEFWPTTGAPGGEAYGWGAFTTELIFAVVLGLETDRDGVRLRPHLPPELSTDGLRLGVAVTVRAQRLELTLAPGTDGLEITGLGSPAVLAPGETLSRRWTELGERAEVVG